MKTGVACRLINRLHFVQTHVIMLSTITKLWNFWKRSLSQIIHDEDVENSDSLNSILTNLTFCSKYFFTDRESSRDLGILSLAIYDIEYALKEWLMINVLRVYLCHCML